MNESLTAAGGTLKQFGQQSTPSRRSLLKMMAGATISAPALTDTAAPERELFVMDTAMVARYGTPLTRSEVETAAKLGYSGIAPDVSGEQTWDHVANKVLPLLDEYRLKLVAIFCEIQVGRDRFNVDPKITSHVPVLKGHGTTIWISTTCLKDSTNALKPSDPAGDRMAAAAVLQVAQIAADYGCQVSLYPHFGTLTQRVEDAVRISRKVGRKNVGVTFNLCHYLRSEPETPLRNVLEIARPYLTLVTTCGADRNGTSWAQLIQPLDTGTFPQKVLLAELQRIGYQGPIGLQGYDVSKNYHIEPSENLRRSMAAWKKLVRGSRARN